MEKIKVLTLTGANTSDVLERGRLRIPKGKKCIGLRCRITQPIANASGGALALATADKQALLDTFTVNLRYGAAGKRKPYNAVSLKRMRTLQRELFGTEVEGYTDSTTGLSNSIANGATENDTWTQIIPTGRVWKLGKDRDIFGMGRSQAMTVDVEIRRGAAPSLTAGLSLNGNTTIEIYPMLVSCKGDRWSYFPEYLETDSPDIEKVFDDALPLALWDRNAVHASTSLTELDVDIDDESIHRQISPAVLIDEIHDAPNYHSEADVVDEVTVLYGFAHDRELHDLPSGRLRFRQPKKDIATMKYSFLFAPLASEEEIKADVEEVSRQRRKAVHASSTHSPDYPQRLQAFFPFVAHDTDDQEWQKRPGIRAAPGERADLFLPELLKKRVRELKSAHEVEGERNAASDILKEVASAFPGAVQAGKGMNAATSQALARVMAEFR